MLCILGISKLSAVCGRLKFAKASHNCSFCAKYLAFEIALVHQKATGVFHYSLRVVFPLVGSLATIHRTSSAWQAPSVPVALSANQETPVLAATRANVPNQAAAHVTLGLTPRTPVYVHNQRGMYLSPANAAYQKYSTPASSSFIASATAQYPHLSEMPHPTAAQFLPAPDNAMPAAAPSASTQMGYPNSPFVTSATAHYPHLGNVTHPMAAQFPSVNGRAIPAATPSASTQMGYSNSPLVSSSIARRPRLSNVMPPTAALQFPRQDGPSISTAVSSASTQVGHSHYVMGGPGMPNSRQSPASAQPTATSLPMPAPDLTGSPANVGLTANSTGAKANAELDSFLGDLPDAVSRPGMPDSRQSPASALTPAAPFPPLLAPKPTRAQTNAEFNSFLDNVLDPVSGMSQQRQVPAVEDNSDDIVAQFLI